MNLTVLSARAVPFLGGTASCLNAEMFGIKVLISLTVKVVPLFGGTPSVVAMIGRTIRLVNIRLKTFSFNGGHP